MKILTLTAILAQLLLAGAQAQTFRAVNRLEANGHALFKSSAAVTGELSVTTTSATGYVLKLSSGTGAAGQGLIYVNNSGLVGIGTASPESQLHIGSNDGAKNNVPKKRLSLEPPAQTGGAYDFQTRDDATNAYLDIGYLGAQSFVMRNDGNIGISTGIPQAKLDIYGGALLGYTAPGAPYSDHVVIRSAGSVAYQGGLLFNNYDAPAGNSVKLSAAYSSTNPSLRIGQVNNATPNTFYRDLLFIAANGDIGVSTDTPQGRLDVKAGGSAAAYMGTIWRNSGGTIVSSVSATGVMMASKFIGNGSGLSGVSGTDNTRVLKAGDTMTGTLTMDAATAFTTSNRPGISVSTNVYVTAGSLGVGTSAPTGRLEVSGAFVSGGTGANIDPVGTLDDLIFGSLANSSKFVIGWNRAGGEGEIDFIANRGAGTVGGFKFYDYTNAGVLNHLMTLRGDGGVSVTGGAFSVGGSTLVVTGGNLGLGNSAPEVTLDVLGPVRTRDGVNAVNHYRDVAYYNRTGGALPRTMKITMPKTWSSSMMLVKVQGYNYTAAGAWELIVGGYNYAVTPGWNNYTARLVGRAPFTQVRLAHDGTSNVLLLGDLSTNWAYPKIVVSDVIVGHNNYGNWGNGWSISEITDETGITNVVTPVLDQYTDNSGNLGLGTASPGGKLDVQASASTPATMAQIWRNGAGTVVSSVSATGVMMAGKFIGNGSGLSGVSGTDNTKVLKAGDTMTGTLTINAATALATSNQPGLTITTSVFVSAGNVGIGASDPATRLQIGGSAPNTGNILRFGKYETSIENYLPIIQQKSQINAGSSNDLALGAQSGTGGILFYTGVSSPENVLGTGSNAIRMGINSAGNVAIGVSSSAFKTEIYGTGQTVANITDAGVRGDFLALNASGSTAGSGGALLFGNSQSRAANSIGWAAIKGYLTNGNTNTIGDLVFLTRANVADTALTEQMRIRSDGYIGVSNGAPQARLDVLGGDSTPATMTQIWRNSGGTIISSMSNTGVMMASKFIGNGSGLSGVSGTDNTKVLKAGDTMTGTLTNSAGTGLALTNATSNLITFNNAGIGAPTFTTRSAGTKVALYPVLGASAADYALGIESNTLWNSVPDTGRQFKWYGGTTQAMLLSGTGNLSLAGDLSAVDGTLSGNLGVGTATPATRLQVGGDGGGSSNYITIGKGFDVESGILWRRAGVVDHQISVDSAENFNIHVDSFGLTGKYFRIVNNNTEQLRLTGNGNLGIGTNPPTYDLHVQKTTAGSPVRSVVHNASNTAGSDARLIAITAGAAGGDPTVIWDNTASNWWAGIDTSDANKWKLSYNAALGTGDKLTVDTSGNIGFGVSPAAPMHLYNAAPALRLSDSTNGAWAFGDIQGGIEFYTHDTDTPGVNAAIKTMHLRAGTGHINSDAGLVFYTSDYTIGGLYARMAIDNYGNISIGTTTVAAGRLDVLGDGTTPATMGQIWRNSAGTIVSSMSNTGVMMASKFIGNGSGLTGVTAIGAASADVLNREDNRIISPSELAATKLKFGFTSWNNDNAAPFADFLHMRSYTDATGGNDNLVMFRKNAIGMRLWQQSWGSVTQYSSYKDIAFTDGTNATGSWPINITGSAATATDDTKVLKAGDTMTGQLVIRTNSATSPIILSTSPVGSYAALYVDTVNNVAIGHTGPGAKLDVLEKTPLGGALGNSQLLTRIRGAAVNNFMENTWLYRDTAGTDWTTARLHNAISVDGSFLTPGTDTKTWWERDPQNNIQSWGNAASALMTLSAGNLGIGTVTPQAKLDIFQSGAFNVNTPGTTRYGMHLTPQNTTADTAAGITFGAGDSGSGQTAQAGIYSQFSGSYGTKLYFATTDAYATGAKTRMMITNAGNVGISTAVPQARLDVLGAGSTPATMTQIWRNSAGTVISSMSDTGVMMASQFIGNGSGLTGVAPSGAAGGALSGTYPNPALANNASYPVTAADGNGLKFWGGSDSYKVSMGNTAEYHYGAVTDYSIKTNMNNQINRGFTWGVTGAAPTASLTTTGIFQTAGDIYSMGDVGIGTTSPAYKLHVVGNGIVTSSLTVSGTGITGAAPVLSVAGSTFNVLLNGNVGIGAGAPAQKLDIYPHGNIRINIYSALGSQYSGASTVLGNNVGADPALVNQMINLVAHASYAGSAIQLRGDDGITFHTKTGAATAGAAFNSPVMKIKANGDVGIGTTTPAYKLHVVGNGIVTSSLTVSGSGITGATAVFDVAAGTLTALANGNVGIGTAAPDARLTLSGSVGGVTGLHINDFSGPTAGFHIDYNDANGATYLDNRYNAASGDIYIRTKTAGTPVDAIFIESAGNVGIGTTVPEVKLDVAAGDILLDYDYGIALEGTGGGNNRTLWNDASNIVRLRNSNAELRLGEAASDVMVIKSGLVGISTMTPQARLDVLGNGATAATMTQIWRNSAGTIISSMSNTGVMMASKFVGDGSGLSGIAIGGDSVTVSTINPTATAPYDGVNITTNTYVQGMVGIGTTSPANASLDVNGNIRIRGSATALPTCDASYRSVMYLLQGAPDKLYMCMQKNVAGTYQWALVSLGQ